MKIADIHAHIFPEKLAEKASHSIGSFYGVSIGREADMPRLCAEDKLAGITRCVVSNSATNASQVQNANTFLAEAVRGHDGYLAFGTIYPGMDGFEEELDRMLELGLRGIKIHPDFQKLAIDDERGIETYKAIARRDLPVLFHMGDDRYDFSSPERLRWMLLLLAVLLVSGIGATGFTHLMTLYMSEGMDAMRTAAAFSLCGLALMAGKCVCGALCDKLGSYRANYLLFGSFILGCTLCVLAPLKSEALMLASAVFLGFGGSLITVGVSIWAGDLSTPERYEKTLRLFQGAYGLGGIVLSFLPGAIADLAGGYAPAYAVFAVMLLYSLFMLQSTYRLAKV